MICANIGDSRTTIGYRSASGGITAVNVTQDHKPDLPAEKVVDMCENGFICSRLV